ncbi:MAG TPA: hypothetical protein DCW31_07200 [Lactobacillus sp.]|nr:hypothetical protein [Lactobacillus sp.]
MQLTFTTEAKTKLQTMMEPNAVLLLDLDDGIGPLSKVLLENGLAYRLFVCTPEQVPASFSNHLQTTIGPLYFNTETEFYMDENMQIVYKKAQNRFELHSEQAILEPSLEVVSL